MTSAAATVARYLLDRTRAQKGARWDQGARRDGWAVPGDAPTEVATFGQRRVCGVPDEVARGLLAWWADGRPAVVTTGIPTALDVLALQARGARFVSLVEDAQAAAHGDPRHPDGLSFALHDLCHLEKFVDPAYHDGQRGFFRACLRLVGDGAWQVIDAGFDAEWQRDRDYVFADMNGSAIFLFAALKMKLAMAARRQRGGPRLGAVTAEERASSAPLYEALFAGLGLPPELRADAHAVSARRDAPDAAARLLAFFEHTGR